MDWNNYIHKSFISVKTHLQLNLKLKLKMPRPQERQKPKEKKNNMYDYYKKEYYKYDHQLKIVQKALDKAKNND